jgi:hypothetical protein
MTAGTIGEQGAKELFACGGALAVIGWGAMSLDRGGNKGKRSLCPMHFTPTHFF